MIIKLNKLMCMIKSWVWKNAKERKNSTKLSKGYTILFNVHLLYNLSRIICYKALLLMQFQALMENTNIHIQTKHFRILSCLYNCWFNSKQLQYICNWHFGICNENMTSGSVELLLYSCLRYFLLHLPYLAKAEIAELKYVILDGCRLILLNV